MKKVAFFVGLSDNIGPVTEHTDIKFDRIITNVGNGFVFSTKIFTSTEIVQYILSRTTLGGCSVFMYYTLSSVTVSGQYKYRTSQLTQVGGFVCIVESPRL